MVYKRKLIQRTRFLILSLTLLAFTLSHTSEASIKNWRFIRMCRRALISVNVLDDPRVLRAHILKVREEIDDLRATEENLGAQPKEAREIAERKYLIQLGYEESLVLRWQKLAPKLLHKVLYHRKNRPVTGYRLTKMFPEKYRLNHVSTYPNIYFLYSDTTRIKYLLLMGLDEGIYIQEKIQIPEFAATMARADNGMERGPSYPAVAPDYTKNMTLLVTALRFPDYSDQWYPVDTVIRDNALTLPTEIPYTTDKD